MVFDWSQATVGQFVDLQRGTTYRSELLDKPGPVLLGLASIERDGGFRSDKLRTYGGDSPAKLLVYPGDIYVSLKDVTQSGDLLGSVARVPTTIAIGRMTQDTVKLIFKNDLIDRAYLYWVLRSPEYRAFCRSRSMGTTNLSLSRDDFLSFPIPEPSKVRRRLVKVLDDLEAKIALTRRMNQALEAMAQAIFKSWFVDFDPVKAKVAAKAEGSDPLRAAMSVISGRPDADIDSLPHDPQAQLAATAALFPDELEESELGQIPKGWGVSKIGSLLELVYGKALKSTDRVEGPIPVYGSGGITGYHNASLVDHASVIVGRKGTVGALYWEDGPFFPIDTTFYVRAIAAPLTYCFYLLQTLRLDKMNTDAAVPGLNRENAYRLPHILPSKGVLTAFDKAVSLWRAAIRKSVETAQTLENVRDEMLSKLLSGKLQVQEVEAEAGA
jgi:type I restriction enzyme, S subunit